MENAIEKRLSRLEKISKKLGEANQITNEVISELAGEISNVVREQIKEEFVTRTKEIEGHVTESIMPVVNATIDTKIRERGLTTLEQKRITAARNKKVRSYIGSKNFNDIYTLYSSFFFGVIKKEFNKHFDVISYGEIFPDQVDEAVDFVTNLDINATDLKFWASEKLAENYKNKIWEDGTMKGKKMKLAYERLHNRID